MVGWLDSTSWTYQLPNMTRLVVWVGVSPFPRNMFRFHVSFRGRIQNNIYVWCFLFEHVSPVWTCFQCFQNLIRNPNWTFQDAHGFQMFPMAIKLFNKKHGGWLVQRKLHEKICAKFELDHFYQFRDTRSFFGKNPALFLALFFFLPKKKGLSIAKWPFQRDLVTSNWGDQVRSKKPPLRATTESAWLICADGWRPVWREPAGFVSKRS